jgi:Ran GTPase-activating protein (RanGAP) involved in mRNA processing and transport
MYSNKESSYGRPNASGTIFDLPGTEAEEITPNHKSDVDEESPLLSSRAIEENPREEEPNETHEKSSLSFLGKYFSYLNFPLGSSHFIFSTLWPATFYALLLSDLFNYYSDDLCDTTPVSLFLGTAGDYKIDTSLWGSDIPGESKFFWGMLGLHLVVAADVGLTALQFFLKRIKNPGWGTPLTEEEFETLSSRVKRTLLPHYAPQRLERELLFKNPFPISSNHLSIYQSLTEFFKNLYSRPQVFEKELELVTAENVQTVRHQVARDIIYQSLQEMSTDSSWWVRWRGRKSLYRIVTSLSEYKLNKLDFDENEKQAILSIRKNAVIKLDELSRGRFYNPETIHAQYLRWKAGESTEIPNDIGFGFFYLIYLFYWTFPTARYVEALILKWITVSEFNTNESHCKKKWEYDYELGRYSCTVCGNWPFVYFRDKDSSQGCLDALLASGEDIISKDLEQLNVADVKIIDLSKRDIGSWSDTYFEQVFDKLSRFTAVKKIIFSQLSSRTGLNDYKIHVLNKYLSPFELDVLNLSGLQLTANQMSILFNQNYFLPIATIDLSRNKLTDDSVPLLKRILQRFNTSEVNFSYNPMTANGVVLFSDVFSQSNLLTLIWKGLHVDQRAFDCLFGNITLSKIKRIDVEQSDFRSVDMTYFSHLLPGAELENLEMEACQLINDQLVTLSEKIPHTKLRVVNFNRNYFTNEGALIFFSDLSNSSVHTLGFSNPRLDDSFLLDLDSIPARITSLELSSRLFSPTGISRLIELLPTQLQHLILKTNHFNDVNLQALGVYQLERNPTLYTVDLGFTDITDAGTIYYAENVLNTSSSPRVLLLVNNKITNRGIVALAKSLSTNRQLIILDVSQCNFNEEGALALFKGIAQSNYLQHLSVDSVPVADSASYLAAQLVTGVGENTCVSINKLTKKDLSIATRRYLAKNAKPKLPLHSLSLRFANLTQQPINALNHVLPFSLLKPTTLHLQGNNFQSAVISDSVSSASSRIESFIPYYFLQLNQPAFESNPRLLLMPHDSFKIGENISTIHGADAAGLIFSALFVFFIFCIYHLIDLLFYRESNSESLNRDELKHLLEIINRLSRQLKEQMLSPLGVAGIFSDRLNDHARKLSNLEEKINIICSDHEVQNEANSSIVPLRFFKVSEAKDDLNQIQKFILRHREQNKRYKQFLQKEQQVAKENRITGRTSVSIIRREILSDQISFEIRDESYTTQSGSCSFFSFFNTQKAVDSKAAVVHTKSSGIK